MENFGFLFSRVSDIGFFQQELKAHMGINSSVVDKYSAEQHMIAQQVKANGAGPTHTTSVCQRREIRVVIHSMLCSNYVETSDTKAIQRRNFWLRQSLLQEIEDQGNPGLQQCLTINDSNHVSTTTCRQEMKLRFLNSIN